MKILHILFIISLLIILSLVQGRAPGGNYFSSFDVNLMNHFILVLTPKQGVAETFEEKVIKAYNHKIDQKKEQSRLRKRDLDIKRSKIL